MKTKKLLALMFSVLFVTNLALIPVSASETVPRWTNTYEVTISHDSVDGYACCYVFIDAFDGTDKIDNINISLFRSVGSVLIIEESWKNLSVAGDEFEFYDEVADVPTGYAYRLQVTADVHRYGVVESLDLYHDVYYD